MMTPGGWFDCTGAALCNDANLTKLGLASFTQRNFRYRCAKSSTQAYGYYCYAYRQTAATPQPYFLMYSDGEYVGRYNCLAGYVNESGANGWTTTVGRPCTPNF